MSAEHHLDHASVHHDWDRSREPVLTSASGDRVSFDLLKAGDGEVEILSLEPGSWGWTGTIPGLGLLPDDFPDAHLKIWDLRNGSYAELVSGGSVPFRPFLGRWAWRPPRTGGYLRSRRTPAAATWTTATSWRARRCGCRSSTTARSSRAATRAPERATARSASAQSSATRPSLRLAVHDRTLDAPSSDVPAEVQPAPVACHGTMGIDGDLYVGAQKAARAMVAWIVSVHGLEPVDAYVLTSVAGDLHIHEVVDSGVWNVGMTLPLNVFA